MAGQFEKDPALQPQAAQFVLLKIDTSIGREWKQWNSRYTVDGTGIPKVYVVRADGMQIYGGTGAPRDLNAFLKRRLEEAGTILNEKELTDLASDYRAAQQALRRRDLAGAVKIIIRNLDTGSYAQTALVFEKLAAELTEKANKQLEEALSELDSTAEPFDSALALLQIEHDYGKLPELQEPLKAALEEKKKSPMLKEVFAQAERVIEARALAADRQWKQAVAAWQKVQEQYPNGPAAELARSRLPDLQKRARIAASSGSGKGSSVGDEKRAASKLRLGKLLLKRRSKKAREYFQSAIELAPGTEIAEEARKLLEQMND